MALAPGTRLGAYEIVAPIGSGGMGEVYRARDSRLNRDVAIKVLPADVAADHDRLARFEREAQVLASLNHSNIANIYGVDDSSGTPALVMELVEGPTLADRIAKGPIPLDEALPIAKQIAEALEAAHEQGIIHRDLKPANIKVRPDGTVKVLDFGLAKAFDPVASGVGSATISPTITTPAMTQIGLILGTAAYMSPEQAKGRPADKRSDVWAFGCVLYEMLTGARAFQGEDVSDTLAAVLRSEPDWTPLNRVAPPRVVTALRRCLRRDAAKRYQHIGDVRLDLEDLGGEIISGRPSVSRRRSLLMIMALMVGVAFGSSAAWVVKPSTLPTLVRFAVSVPPTMPLRVSPGVAVVLSPDGNTLVYTAASADARLIKRRIDSNEFESIRGSELGSAAPFFSPDNRWIAFSVQGQLRKIPVEGGVATTICDISAAVRGTWGDDDSIIFSDKGRLFRVAASGGEPRQLFDDRSVPEGMSEPHFIARSRAVLVQVGGGGRIEAVELPSLRRHELAEGSMPQIVPTGDLVFHRNGRLWTAKLDQTRWAITGSPVQLGIGVRVLAGVPLFSISQSGSLAYFADTSNAESSMVWLDRAGRAVPAIQERAAFEAVRLSPDGKRVAVNIQSTRTNDLWVYELDRGTRLRLTTSGNSRRPVWSPDGTRILFNSDVDGDTDLYVISVNGGKPERLLRRPGAQFPDAWAPDGKSIVFNEGGATRDLWMLPIGSPSEPKPIVQTTFSERGAAISPDGHWMAFTSDESGRDEIYVTPYPNGGIKVPVSRNGGRQPAWSRNGTELFFRERNDLMAVSVQLSPLHVGSPQKLFDFNDQLYLDNANVMNYDVAADGRFLAVKVDETHSDEIQVVVNWAEELKTRGMMK